MKNLICIPFAYEDNRQSGVNLHSSDKLNIYLKNACVALLSAKKNNEEDEVMLATNLSCEQIPHTYLDILQKNGVLIETIPFDLFNFSNNYLWSLAYYKLCVLSHIVNMGYENVSYMDTDVYIQGNFKNIWEECEQNILLYDICHGLGTRDYQIICDEMTDFARGKKMLCTHYGGEFFAANAKKAKEFVGVAKSIYEEMIARNFVTTKGDEFIISLAANQMKQSVKNAGAYIFRFWTGANFRLVSTCYENNAVTVLHMPGEKERGILKIYSSYATKGMLPDKRKVWKICRLKQKSMIEVIAIAVKSILKM